MLIRCTTLWSPKQGNSVEEYEDAAACDNASKEALDIFRCAVADGASEASFSKVWAQLLVKGYVEGLDLPKLQTDWRTLIATDNLSWYAEEKAQLGAFAALVGLTIRQDKKWEALAIGDSCLVQLRAGKIVHCFPLKKAEEFNNTPFLISSNEQSNQNMENFWVANNGTWKSHDVFLLMTDAITLWLLKNLERRKNAVANILALPDQKTFEQFVEGQRSHPDQNLRMKNDDATLMKIIVKAKVKKRTP